MACTSGVRSVSGYQQTGFDGFAQISLAEDQQSVSIRGNSSEADSVCVARNPSVLAPVPLVAGLAPASISHQAQTASQIPSWISRNLRVLQCNHSLHCFDFERFSQNRWMDFDAFQKRYHEKQYSELGHGGLGTVYPTYDASTVVKVSKWFEPDDLRLYRALAGAFLMPNPSQQAPDSALLGCYNVSIESSHNPAHPEYRIHMAMPKMSGNIVDLFDKFKQQDWLIVWRDIFKGLLELQERNIVHRDLKLDNVLVQLNDQGRVACAKITDFDFAHALGHKVQRSSSPVGTELHTFVQAGGEHYSEPVTGTHLDAYGAMRMMHESLDDFIDCYGTFEAPFWTRDMQLPSRDGEFIFGTAQSREHYFKASLEEREILSQAFYESLPAKIQRLNQLIDPVSSV